MEVKIIYQKQQFDEAVKYVSQKNDYFRNQDDLIEKRLREILHEVAFNSDRNMLSTMGFRVDVVMRRYEGIDFDENICVVDILVDPALSILEYDSVEEIVSGEIK